MAFSVTALDSVEAKRWGYMAQVLAEALDELTTSRVLRPGSIPVAVLASAKRFFHLALAVRESPGSRNLNASVANYRIAADALRALSEVPLASREQLEQQMRAFSDFLPLLAGNNDFSDQEIDTAKQLEKFFRQIAVDASAEDYQRFAQGNNGSFRTAKL